MENNRVYVYKNTNNTDQRYKVVILRANNSMFHSASFYNIQQFERFLNRFGLKLNYTDTYNKGTDREVKIYRLDYILKTDFDGGFWKLADVPENAIKIKALSNGSIVDCYYVKDEQAKIIVLYRPNPNAKEVYKPLELQEHIAYQRLYGIY